MYVIKDDTIKNPIKIWSKQDSIEESAIDQLKRCANLPFLYKHVAAMPDCHTGYGLTIGGVIACDGVVIPNAVGYDIGCGMLAMKTSITHDILSTDTLKTIMGRIRQAIPVGFNHHNAKQEWSGWKKAPTDIPIIEQQLNNAKKQLGTLGSGNHFIEIQVDEDGYIWFMIHSGSRNFGYKIAEYYNKIAQKLCMRWYSNISAINGDNGLAFLPIEDIAGKDYMRAMGYALHFAKENRRHMIECIRYILHDLVLHWEQIDCIDIHHNYARWENHFGKNVIIHRKGATSAKLDELGIIPGSQGTNSFIVTGLGNSDSFNSCSHGAGRKLSRKKAKNTLDLQTEIDKLEKLNIIHSIRSKNNLDEASGAYKDINIVMAEQSDLVKIKHTLTPLGVIKA